MKPDLAILKALGLDASKTEVSAHGGAGSSGASTLKISTILDNGTKKAFFMKCGSGREAEIMFEGEYASLNAIHDVVPSLCPAALSHGHLNDSPDKSYLITEFLDLSSRQISRNISRTPSLAAKMAKLHSTPAPVPEEHGKPMFGFPVVTCCGDTPQENTYAESWAKFYAEHRLRFILRQAEKNNGSNKELKDLVNTTIAKVVPRLIGDDHLNNGKGITPVIVHGDLWSGNASRGRIGSSDGDIEELIFDPSACYAHNEYDLGIMNMFGGFGPRFFREYHDLCPKTEPVHEYDDRIRLYEIYHHLNHYALFGGSWRSGAENIMKDLIEKYGKDNL